MPYKISLNTNRICSYYASERRRLSPIEKLERWEEFERKGCALPKQVAKNDKINLGLSYKAKKRLKNSINWLTACSAKRKVSLQNGKSVFWFRVGFVTLSLPSAQVHSHAEIKSKCLNRFLTDLRRKHNVKNYVWKAELQKNGNIHFHVTIDKFIHYLEIRKLWNSAISPLGYIGSYAQKFRSMSEAGYINYVGAKSAQAVAKAKKAFAYGVSTNWLSPNSTDVKNVKNVQNLAAYLSKYLAKPLTNNASTKEQKESAKNWKGRTWFCSTSLSKLGNKQIKFDSRTKAFFDWFRNYKKLKRFESEYSLTIFYNLTQLPKQIREWLRQELLSHAINLNYPFPSIIPNW